MKATVHQEFLFKYYSINPKKIVCRICGFAFINRFNKPGRSPLTYHIIKHLESQTNNTVWSEDIKNKKT